MLAKIDPTTGIRETKFNPIGKIIAMIHEKTNYMIKPLAEL